MSWNIENVAETYSSLAQGWTAKKQYDYPAGAIQQVTDPSALCHRRQFGKAAGFRMRDRQDLPDLDVALQEVVMIDASRDMCRIAETRISPKLPATILTGVKHLTGSASARPAMSPL